MPYDDFESMLYEEVPEKPVPSRPQEKPVERFTEPQAQIDAQDEIPIPDAPPAARRYEPMQLEAPRRIEHEEILTLPHSGDAERSVLGSMLINLDACELACILLAEEDFYVPANAKVFKAIKDLVSKNKAVILSR